MCVCGVRVCVLVLFQKEIMAENTFEVFLCVCVHCFKDNQLLRNLDEWMTFAKGVCVRACVRARVHVRVIKPYL